MSATIRPVMSAGPPAANGTITVIVLFGKSCACAPLSAVSASAIAPILRTIVSSHFVYWRDLSGSRWPRQTKNGAPGSILGSAVSIPETVEALCARRLEAAHAADAVELNLLARILLGFFAGLIALVEHFDLLQFLERLAERRLRIVELCLEFASRTPQVLAAVDRGLGIGRIGEMRWIVDARAVLLGLDL